MKTIQVVFIGKGRSELIESIKNAIRVELIEVENIEIDKTDKTDKELVEQIEENLILEFKEDKPIDKGKHKKKGKELKCWEKNKFYQK